ncbi:MAG: L-threonylcarbamoyladenylate synthase [Actinomycetota bacterium]|jgi:L-threonylcarbamoyladenylate synthase
MSGSSVDEAVEALRAGRPVVLPTDTVYGLCASPYRSRPSERLYALKGREPQQPTALLAADVEMLFECVPELRGRAGVIARALLPGPYTLVLPNPARRYPWLAGANRQTIGVRVPELPESARAVVSQVGAVAATSANLRGGPDPRTVREVPAQIVAGAGAVVDAGELPGTPSTVLDFTGSEPRVVREGAAAAPEALARARDALA